MPAERLSMRKIRDVLRLRFGSRLSEREIGRSLLLSNGSVNRISSGLVWRAWTGLRRPAWTTRRRAACVPAASDRRDRSRSSAARLDARRQGDAPQGRNYGALVGGYPPHIRTGSVTAGFARTTLRSRPAAAEHAPEPRRRRKGLRRFCRRHDQGRPSDGRGSADEAVRRGHGRVELHLRAGAAERADRRLDRRARRSARLSRRRAEVCGLRQSEGSGHEPGSIRAGADPQLQGVRRPLRHGDPAGEALQAARQGQGRAVGTDRRAVDPGPAAQSPFPQLGRSRCRDRRIRLRRQRPHHEGLRREPTNCSPRSTGRR